jgi:hypothetical protein
MAGIVDFNFADFYPQIVRYRASASRMQWHPNEFGWVPTTTTSSSSRAGKVDEPSMPGSILELVAHSGPWWLYRKYG